MRMACREWRSAWREFFVLGRLMHSTLYGVGAVDYVSTALVAAVLFGVALSPVGCPPAFGAVDPMVALRDE